VYKIPEPGLAIAESVPDRSAGVIFERSPKEEFMSTLQEFRCEVCGTTTTNPVHWFVIQCGDASLTVLRWNFEAASAPDARHFCGEAHAQVYISRWFDLVCSPSKPDYAKATR